MDSYIIEHIRNRMKEMGFERFHFEPVFITASSNNLEIKAYNEYYYLLNSTVPSDLVISSDTNVFNEAASYSVMRLYRLQEFTGLIEIKQGTRRIQLEFMRVLPY